MEVSVKGSRQTEERLDEASGARYSLTPNNYTIPLRFDHLLSWQVVF